jgi:hypothetical protein
VQKPKLNYDEELKQIISAIEIVSSSSLNFCGKAISATEPAPAESSSNNNPPIVTQIQNTLYHYSYCRRFRKDAPEAPATTSVAADPQFIARLSQTNQSSSRWDAGWRVRRVESNGQIWAEKGGVVSALLPGEYMNFEGPGMPLRSGGSVTIFAARESTNVQPGLYFAFGETVMGTDRLDMVRFYWNIDSEGIAPLLQDLSRNLNRFQIPFQFKCSIYQQGYDRRDAAVLYVQKKYYAIARELVNKLKRDCESHLRDDVPFFTLPVGKGVALAEDPGNGESFGMNRCRHVAEALWTAHTGGVTTEKRIHEIRLHFQKNGLDLDRPYLSAGSAEQYN